MAIFIWEKFDSRSRTEARDASGSVDLKYGVSITSAPDDDADLDDDDLVAQAVDGAIGLMYGRLYLHNYRIDTVGAGYWDVTAHYGAKDPHGTVINWDTSSGTVKQFISFGTRYFTKAPQKDIVRITVSGVCGALAPSLKPGVVPDQDYTVTVMGQAATYLAVAADTNQTVAEALLSELQALAIPGITWGGDESAPPGVSAILGVADVAGTHFPVSTSATGGGVLEVTQIPGDLDTGTLNFNNAINVGKDKKVAGVDVEHPKCSFTVTRVIPQAYMTQNYFELLFNRPESPVNGDTVTIWSQGIRINFRPGELLFHGATGGFRESDWEFVLKFSYSKNLTNYTFNGITGIVKDGWDYLWPYQLEEVSSAGAKAIIPVTRQVNVERVYRRAPLQPLFGGPAAPQGLVAQVHDNEEPSYIQLTWDAVAGAESYNIYRGGAPGGEIPAQRGVTGTSYVDIQFDFDDPDPPYYYLITAVDPTGESGPSNEVLAA
jgi:hypothetical protein